MVSQTSGIWGFRSEGGRGWGMGGGGGMKLRGAGVRRGWSEGWSRLFPPRFGLRFVVRREDMWGAVGGVNGVGGRVAGGWGPGGGEGDLFTACLGHLIIDDASLSRAGGSSSSSSDRRPDGDIFRGESHRMNRSNKNNIPTITKAPAPPAPPPNTTHSI